MAWTVVDGWSGRVWVSEKGKRTFYIRQFRDGKRWDVSTKCSTLRAAMKELERFEQDPAAYRPAGSGEQLVLDDAMIERYASWSRAQTESTDARWLEAKKRYLRWWAEQLDGRPLTSISLSRILDCLDGQVSRKDRIVSIKHLYSWLRQTDQIAASDDPTLDALPVPQGRPEQDTSGESKVITEEDFRAVLPKLPPVIADLCRVMAGTGCHLSEALRLMAGGRVELRQAPALPVLCFRHKGGHIHRVEVTEPVSEAARRLLGAKAPARETVYRAIRRACVEAGVEQWTPGRFRHTFATNAIARGVAPSAVALALGHKGAATSLKWYATTAVAPRVSGGYEG
jgi:integrase